VSATTPAVPETSSQLHRGHVPREVVLVGLLLAEMGVLSLLSPYFLTVTDLLGSTQFFVEIGLMALGMTLVIITGGIDLSVGGELALTSVIVGFGYQAGIPLPLAILIGVAAATAGGTLNGILTTRLGVHPLVITIATGELYRGIAEALSNSNEVSVFPSWFNVFGQSHVGPLPSQTIVLAIAAIAIGATLARGRFGRHVYAIGINEVAARYSGVPVQRTKILVYSVTGFLSGIAGVIYTSRVSTSASDAELGIELSVIAAVALGGARIAGGAGTIVGTMLGVLMLALLQQGLLLDESLNSSWILVIIGAVMVATVFANEFFRRRE
jgi:rhamnose transport system permease protein